MEKDWLREFRTKSIVKHNITKIKLVSTVTTIMMLSFLVIELLYKMIVKGDLISLNWLPYVTIISINIIWHVNCLKIQKQITNETDKQLVRITNIYVYTMLLTGSIISMMDKAIFNDLMMYTLILLVCSTYFVLEKKQIVVPMIISSIIIIIGMYLMNGYTDGFILKMVYLSVLTPIAYYVSKSMYKSFVKATFTQAKLILETEERRKVMKQLRDVNRRQELQAKLDPLTKIYNRRAVNEYMNRLTIQAENSTFRLTTIMFDVDYFKQYNDTYGHLAGDEVLVKIGQMLQEISEDFSVFAARWGGEEFMVVLLNANDQKVQKLCETILLHVESLNIEHIGSLISDKLTVSIGAHSVKVKEKKDVLQSLDFADLALYDVKNNGRNGFTIRIV